MSSKNLLVELFVEELPPKALKKLGDAFSGVLFDSLKAQGLASDGSKVTPYASPRRLAVHISSILAVAPDQEIKEKLMPVSVALDKDGKPTDALRKRLGKIGRAEMTDLWPNAVDGSDQLYVASDGKTDAVFLRSLATGTSLHVGLLNALEESLKKLPIPKVMTYQLSDGWSTVNFVRPVHKLVALHGTDIVPISTLGLTSGRETLGHRFEAAASSISIKDADSYESQMEIEGAVIPSFEKRRADIARQLVEAAAKIGGNVKPVEDEALLDEVTALVERPNVLVGKFDESFLEVPQECLILTMKANQKYFPLLDAEGKLTNKFLIVSNIRPADASAVVGGNERVVRPRLADAKFFFDQDRKKPLESRVEKLGNVVYHNKLGTQLERVNRIEKLAGEIARKLNANPDHGERAARLCKADLLTDMVGEFPELQGIMGQYYARQDGEDASVAQAIEAHYHPRFAGDTLPQDNIGAAVALADKLDTLVGIYGIGQVPTGEKDPFGLRRHGLGVLRILAEKELPLDLLQLLQITRSLFTGVQLSESVAQDVHGFLLERLKNYLRERGFSVNEIEAVVSQNPTRIDLVLPRLEAVCTFAKLPEAEALSAANKRIQNILKKAEEVGAHPDLALLQEPAEKALFSALGRISPIVLSAVENGGYTDALTTLAGVRTEVDTFFDEVMVMTEEPLIRANRLALLNSLGGLMNQVADISKLAQ